jgi:hypothetical protein
VRSAPRSSASSSTTRPSPSSSGTCSGNAGIRFARRCRTWGRCCSRGCCN